MSYFFGQLLLGLFLFSLSHHGHAKHHQQKSAKGEIAQKAPHKKTAESATRVTSNSLLYPFTLRLLYTPSYRFLTKRMRDRIEESKDAKANKASIDFAQFFPISAGLEGEFAFNQWVSLALSGNFSYHGEVSTYEPNTDIIKKIFKDKEVSYSNKFTEFVVGSSFYFNVLDYFRLGVGAELAFENIAFTNSQVEDGQKFRHKYETTSKRAYAQLALRRDFFLSRFGFGVGLNARIPLGDNFDKNIERSEHIDDKPVQTPGEDVDNKSDDDDIEEMYSLVLMPVLYVAF